MYEDVPALVFLAPSGYYSKHGQTICKMKYKSDQDTKVLAFLPRTHASISYTFSGHGSSIFPFALTYTAFKLRPVVLICQDAFVFKGVLLFGTYCQVYAGFILNRVRTNAVDWGRRRRVFSFGFTNFSKFKTKFFYSHFHYLLYQVMERI